MKTKPLPVCIILWADDDPDDMSVVRGIVEAQSNNCNIREVGNGLEVFDYLNTITSQSQFPCLVVLDINMPLLNGTETVVRIKAEKKYKDLPVAVFTTSDSDKDRSFCKRHGVLMITKPSTYRAFVEAVRQLLSLCSSHCQGNAYAN